MSRRSPALSAKILAMVVLCAVAQGCSGGSSGGTSSTGGTAAGGVQGAGGANSSGGSTTSTGGANSSGGNLQQGGSSNAGGARAGASGSGGAADAASGGSAAGGSGGAASADASASSGGTTSGVGGGLGGQVASGGQVGSGGRLGSGGATSSGGASGVSCPSPAIVPGNTTHTLQVGGQSRAYVLHVPSGYTGKTAVPLIVDFHGHGGSGPGEQTDSPYPPVVDGDGVIMAFPTALGDWNVGPCCADGIDDVEFAKALVKDVAGIGCVDAKRVYAVGFSMGGGMTNYLACHAADVFAAFAPAAFDLLQEIVADCKPARPITVVSFRSTADPLVPYAGGVSNLVRPITFLGAVNTMKKWAEYDSCTGSAADLGNGCQGYSASQCQAGVEVILCTKQGGGHEAGNATLGWPVLKRHALP